MRKWVKMSVYDLSLSCGHWGMQDADQQDSATVSQAPPGWAPWQLRVPPSRSGGKSIGTDTLQRLLGWDQQGDSPPAAWIISFLTWSYPIEARRSNQSILKEINPEYSLEHWCWNWSSNTLVTWCKELNHLKRLWCWERLKEVGERDNRRWDGWMHHQLNGQWVWASSRSWWRTGKPGMLQSMGSQRVRHN